MDWNDAWDAAGEAIKNDQETIFEMSLRIAQLEAENERLKKIERLAGKLYRASMNTSLIRSNRDPRNCFPIWWFGACLGWLGEALGGE